MSEVINAELSQWERYLKDRKAKFRGKPQDGGNIPTLEFQINKGSLVITIWPSKHEDDNKRPFKMSLKHDGVMAVLAVLNEVNNIECGSRYTISNFKGQPSNPILDNELLIGRDQDGYVYFAGKQKGKSMDKIIPMPDQTYVRVTRTTSSGNTEYDVGFQNAFMRSLEAFLHGVVRVLVLSYMTSSERQEEAQKQFKDRKQNTGGGQGGHKQSSPDGDFGGDIPF